MREAEYRAWQAFYAREPWGGARLDIWMARLISLFAARWSRRRQPAKRFMPDWYPWTPDEAMQPSASRNARTAAKIRAYFGELMAAQKERRG